MRNVVIENPVVNSPFEEPQRHFRFTDEGITDEIVPQRRISQYFVPIAPPKKKGRQASFETEWTADRIEENRFINRVRGRVEAWRRGGHVGVTRMTRDLLRYWTDSDRERPLFFCQIEAVETAIYIAEVADKYGDQWIANTLREASAGSNPDLFRVAFKMATGSGKTVVMAMLIAWQTLNKLANPRDPRFSDAFLLVTPGITIRDRLRVLLPSDPNNYYRERDVVTPEQLAQLHRAKIVVTNFHTFLRRETGDAGKLTKAILTSGGRQNPFQETPDQMVRRVCRELGGKRNLVVINDEAHHCYRHKLEGEDENGGKLVGDERVEAEKREEQARVWVSGLEAVKRKFGVRVVYDLSATPFFLKGSGYPEGTLFPWVVSNFSLIDAIESGIVKVPRVPVADDSMAGDLPTYRHIWPRIRDHLPKKGRGTEAATGEPKLPAELQGALHSLYANYERHFETWAKATEQDGRRQTPPVFIVVRNNTNVSKLVFDYIAGYERTVPPSPALPANGEGEAGSSSPPFAGGIEGGASAVLVPGQLPLFSNVQDGRWAMPPRTLLIDSEQLESGEALGKDFRKALAPQIGEFRDEYRARFPERDPDALTDEDIMREAVNTVGKPGRLGASLRCVVSVSMLTEGWDASTVTHILGVRAFGTQLLCEQVVGRGLRRTSYATEPRTLEVGGQTVTIEAPPPEYAEVYGVPFSFLPCAGATVDPPPPKPFTRVRALPERADCRITFPRVIGYRWEPAQERLTASFSEDAVMVLSSEHVPTTTEVAPIVGEGEIHALDDLRACRMQRVAFLVAKSVLETYYQDDDGDRRPWLFPDVLRITRDWLGQCVVCHDHTFPQLLLLHEYRATAAGYVHRAIAASEEGQASLRPILAPYDTIGSTDYVDFDTTKPVYETDPGKCHVSHVVADTKDWEQKMAQALEAMPEVLRYVKNHNLGFTIPYVHDGEEHAYTPDFIVHVAAPLPTSPVNGGGASSASPPFTGGTEGGAYLNLIIEVTGERYDAKATKVVTAKTLWVPAVNNHGGFGRWAFLEVQDPWNAETEIRAFVDTVPQVGGSQP